MTKLSAGWPGADMGLGCRGEQSAGSPPRLTRCQAARSRMIRPAWAIPLRRLPARREEARQPAPDQPARGPALRPAAVLRTDLPVRRSGPLPRLGPRREALQRPAAARPAAEE